MPTVAILYILNFSLPTIIAIAVNLIVFREQSSDISHVSCAAGNLWLHNYMWHRHSMLMSSIT